MRATVFLCFLLFSHAGGFYFLLQCLNILNFFADVNIPEKGKDVPEVIALHGYTPEVHYVTTGDGYILEIHRVCQKNGICSGKPCLLQHGLISSSITWVWNTPDKNLAYILLAAGYDVWLGNIRGNEYGQNHTTLSPDSEEFWNFSWDEMAKYDLPAMIDHILQTNGADSLTVIGHSMGTTMTFAMLSTIPSYNQKVSLFVAMAPVVIVENIKTPLKALAASDAATITLLNTITNGKLGLSNPVTSFLLGVACAIPPLSCLACTSLFFAITGPDYTQINASRINYILSVTPSDCSLNTVKQYLQEVNSKKFQMFDLGTAGNMEKYNQSTPPEYNMGNINTKVALMTGPSDWLADIKDVKKIPQMLGPNLVWNYDVPYPPFSHTDFVFAIDVNELAYDPLMSFLGNVSSGTV